MMLKGPVRGLSHLFAASSYWDAMVGALCKLMNW